MKGWRKMYKHSKKCFAFLVLLVCIGLLVGKSEFFENSTVNAATTRGVVTAESLNVRSGPGTRYEQVKQDGKYVYLYKDDTVQILGEEDNFYKVKFTYNGKSVTGYSSKAFIKIVTATKEPETDDTVSLPEEDVPGAAVTNTATPTPTSTPADTDTITVTGLKIPAKITASALRVRTKSSATAKQLTYEGKSVSLKKGKSVSIRRQKIIKGVVWYYIRFKYSGKYLKGYVLSDYVQLKFTDTVKGKISTDSKLVVRNSAGVSDDYLMYNNTIVKLADGKNVKIKEETTANCKKWFKISFTYKKKTLKGYVLANHVLFRTTSTETQNKEQTTTTDNTEVTTSGAVTATPTPTSTSSAIAGVSGVVVSDKVLNVRVQPGTDKEKLTYKGVAVQLTNGKVVTILDSMVYDGAVWYYVSFTYEDTVLKGYVLGTYIEINSAG